MPTISMFYGIIIYLYYNDNKQHYTPHIHAVYQDFEGVYDINTVEIIDGELPVAKHRLVVAWMELHRDELIADWKLAAEGNKPFKINPLV